MRLLVVGMHRSGTSAVARLLSKMGIPTAADEALLGADPHNRLGHYEVLALTDFNDELLAELGGHWAAPPAPGTSSIQRDMAATVWGDRGRALIAGHLPAGTWFWKDPRLSLLLPFWLAVLGDDTRVVYVHRSPESVAASLERRNGLGRDLSLALWKRYLFAAASDLDGVPCFAIDFDSLVDDPDAVVPRLAEWLESGGAEVEVPLEPPVERGERHHVSESSDWLGPPDLRGFTGEWFPSKTTADDPAIPLSAAAPSLLAGAQELAEVQAEARQALDLAQDLIDGVNAELVDARAQAQMALDDAQLELRRSQSAAQTEIDRLNTEIRLLASELQLAREDHERMVTRHREVADHAAHLAEVLATERSSTAYQAIEAYRRGAGRVLPPGSSRRSAYERSVGAVRQVIHRRRLRHSVAPGHSTESDLGLRMCRSEDPVASLVIPVHGGVEITETLLRSIASHTAVAHEVIVVDDASPDDIPDFLATVEGLNVVTNSSNQGYLRSSNIGAARARGEFIVLLNSDTEVTPGWLESLLGPFDEPLVGAVGARLVYPDGRLQEAGSIIWRDANGWNYGKNGWADRFDVMRRREVDYCSAACLAVRRSAWEQLGGFDERYAPAYYEDTDLCFGIRALGMKVIYQPRAHIIHHEGATHGTDIESGTKSHQVFNREKFVAKWADALASQWESSAANVRRAADRERGPAVLVVDHYVPTPDRDSGSLRMSLLLKLLREQEYRVRFFPDNQHQNPPYERALQDQGIEVAYGSIDPQGYLLEHGDDIDVAILSRPQVAIKWLPILRENLPDVPVIYDMVDFHGLREERRAEVTGTTVAGGGELLARIEQLLVSVTDVTFAITDDEAERMHEIVPAATIVTVPNVHERVQSTTPFAERQGLLFVGSWAHLPNRDAVEWMIDEILPILRTKLPGVETHIVGSDVPSDIGNGAEDVIVHGWVEELDDLFDQIRLSVAPLRYGAGMKGKVGDSLARGVPVVATPVAAEGFDLGEFDLRPVADAGAFADRVIELYTDEGAWERTAAGGVRAIDQNTGPDAVRRVLDDVLRTLVPPRGSS